jgi:hypothetical protein
MGGAQGMSAAIEAESEESAYEESDADTAMWRNKFGVVVQ